MQVPIHTSDVRDLVIHSSGRLVLTVAFDGKLVLTSIQDKKVAAQVALPQAGARAGPAALANRTPMQCSVGFKTALWSSTT